MAVIQQEHIRSQHSKRLGVHRPPVDRSGPLPSLSGRDAVLLDRHLLAFLQRTAGNTAVADAVTAQRDALTAPPAAAPAPPAVDAPSKDPEQEAVADAITRIVTAGKALAGTAAAHGMHDDILNQVLKPKARTPAKAEPLASFQQVLYGPDVLKNLKLIAKAKKKETRKALQKAVIETVIEQLLGAANAAVSKKPPLTPAEEAALVEGFDWSKHINNGYPSVRLGLLATFGGLEVGTEKALQNANTYYASMTREPGFLGRKPLVHSKMAEALGKAQTRFDELVAVKQTELGEPAGKAWAEAARKTVKGIGGLAIRANVNNKLRLSNHSFGCAIDVSEDQNPNVSDFPTELVEAITGVNVFVGSNKKPTGDNITTGMTMDQVRVEAERLHQASDRFKAVFQSDASLKAEMLRQAGITVGLTPPAGAGDTLFELSKQVVTSQAATAAAKSKKARKALVAAADSASGKLFDFVLSLFGGRVQGTPDAPMASWEEADLAMHIPKARKLTTLLIDLSVRYQSTFTTRKTKAGRVPARTESTAIATTGSLAYGGFMNLSADIVAVLAGSEGGGLIWLGGTQGTKDFMHFDLPGKLPARY